jgi:signal transduction histidine kinase
MQEEFLRLFEHCQRAAFLLALNGDIRAMNSAAARIFENEESAPAHLSALGDPALGAQLIALLGELLANRTISIEMELNNLAQCRLNFSLVEMSEPGALLIIEPIATIATIAIDARQAQTDAREMEEFIYNISHDLRSPLVTLMGFASAMKEDFSGQLPPAAEKYLQYIINGANRLDARLAALLDYSRVGRMSGKAEQVPFAEILQEAGSMLKSLLEKRQAEITAITDFPIIYCDRERIVKVMVNLISNAINYTPEERRPHVEIGCRREDNNFRFWVRDNGIGIDPELREKIFELFYRIKELNKVEGAGMGLSLTRKIIASLGGEISVAAEGAIGSTFYFTLPVVPDQG